jgi:hypothetical protein
VPVLANDLDLAGGGLTVIAITQPAHGAASINPGAATVHYAVPAGFSGVDSFTYTLQDVNGQQSTATVAIVVTALAETDEAPQVTPVDPTTQTMASFTSTQATVTANLPAGFFTGALGATDILFLSYTPIITPTEHTQTPPGTLHFGNFQFELTAFVNNQPQHGIVFAQPVTLTIVYNPALLFGLDEGTLGLLYWDGANWSSNGIVLVSRDLAAHTLTVTLAHLSEFALFAAPGTPTVLDPEPETTVTGYLYLPAVMNKATGFTASMEAATPADTKAEAQGVENAPPTVNPPDAANSHRSDDAVSLWQLHLPLIAQ